MNARLLGLCLLLGALPAQATNGYFSHGYSLAQKALGGAGTADASDALVVTINPAAMAWVGEATDVSLSLFNPVRDYRAEPTDPASRGGVLELPPGGARSHNEYWPIPAISINRPLGERTTWGIAMYGNGGLNTEYLNRSAVFGRGVPGFETECVGSFGGGPPVAGASDSGNLCGYDSSRASVDMAQLFVAPSVALRVGDGHAVGLSLLLAANRFGAQGLAAFRTFSNAPDRVSDLGHDWSFGAGVRVGGLMRPLGWLHLGASWQPRIRMSAFSDYAGLFAEKGGFDIPQSWNLGLRIDLGGAQRLLVDYQAIDYADIASVGNPLDPERFVSDCALPRLSGDNSPSDACLGAASGPGFGWRDMRVLKIGYAIELGRTTYRLGYSRTTQPIPADEVLFNVLAPGVIDTHYTAGMSLKWSETLSVGVSLSYAANNPVRGRNPLSNVDPDALGSDLLGFGGGVDRSTYGVDDMDQWLTLDMRQIELSFGLSWRFWPQP